ncbi:MAG TPA: ankyrin repeat domain-containing protein [Pyrinomonadaceae bacterium]|nr:ankyrin repeat domain-containing protein [Pyrinomonadaceae bacterium]
MFFHLLPLSLALVFVMSAAELVLRSSTIDDALDRALIEAIEHHDRRQVIELLNRGASVNAKGINLTALQTAVFEADVEIVKLLLQKGAKINDEDLVEASRGVQGNNQKSTVIVKLLLAGGAAINANGVDALSEAAKANNLDLVNLFLARGVNPNGKTHESKTVLFEVVETDSIDAIRALLAAGADAKAINSEDGQTILMRAARASHISDTAVRIRVLKMLLAAGAGVHARDNDGRTALLYSVQQYMSEAGGVLSRPEIVRLLLKEGADVNASDKQGNTALILTVQVWRTPLGIPQLLLDKGANVNLANANGQTALMLAAKDGKNEIVQLLLAKGAKLELKDKQGKTALVYAIEEGQPETVGLLANNGADLKTSPYKSEAELRSATHNYGLLRAVAFHQPAEVRKFLAAGADPNFRGPRGRTALIVEAENSYGDEVINLLLANKTNVDAADDEGNTSLMLAAKGNRDEIVKLLLEHNASVNIRNKDQKTALLFAAEDGHTQVAELLLAKGADVSVRDAKGMTALLLAAEDSYAQEDLVKLLLAKGAEPNVTDSQGNTALMLASRAGAFQVIEALVAGGVDVNAKNKDGWTALRHLKESPETWTRDESASQRRALVMARLTKGGAKED